MSGAVHKVLLARPLQELFSAIPRRYDLVNTILTWGSVNRWRRAAVMECLSAKPANVLDLGCGTGELTVKLVGQAAYAVQVTGLDCSQPMLDLAIKKSALLSRKPLFIKGFADALPFPDRHFDCVAISFALRNMVCENLLAQVNLNEIFRVIAPGGRLIALETGQPENGLLRALFHRYLRWFVFPTGWLISGDREAYRYFAESAARFLSPKEVRQLLLQTGFSHVTFRRFLFGAVVLYVALKVEEK